MNASQTDQSHDPRQIPRPDWTVTQRDFALRGSLSESTSALIEDLAQLWNSAAGAEFALSAHYLTYRLCAPPLWPQTVGLVVDETGSLGFILASAPQANAVLHIEAWAVRPAYQRRGIGAALLAWATAWGSAQGCTQVQLGTGPLRLLPGMPVSASASAVAHRLGFVEVANPIHDLACDLSGYTPPPIVTEIPGLARPLAPNERAYLDGCLQSNASMAQRQSVEHFLNAGGRTTDLMSLWTETGLQGIAQIVVEDSIGGIQPWFPYDLPKPWAAVHMLVIPTHQDHQPDAAPHWALLDATLRRLHNMGVNGCVLAEVAEPDLYTPFGFRPYHSFRPYRRAIA